MSHRPLVFVTGLTVGDYLLWNWSLGGNHEVIALVSGLTLPPLVLATLWLLAMAVGRLLARSASRVGPAGGAARGARGARASRAGRRRSADGGIALEQPESAAARASAESRRKIAA